ncbi:MAG: glycosyltransferase family 4 protein, partial [Acholeplasmataceae bacterium]
SMLYEELPDHHKDRVSYCHLFRGSTYPDRYLPYRVKIHDYKGSIGLVMSVITDLVSNPQTPEEFGKKLGIVSHFLIDYTTAFHANPRYRTKHLRHRAYEIRVDRCWQDFHNTGGPVISSLETVERDIEAYLDHYQSRAVLADPMRDLEHAVSMTRSLFDLIFAAYAKEEEYRKDIDHGLPRVAIVSDTYYPHVNGVSNTIHEMVSHFKRTGQPYILIAPAYKKPVWSKRMGVRMRTVPSIKFPLYPDAVISLPGKRNINRILDAFQPDVIHCLTEFNLGLSALRYGKKRGIPVLSNYSSHFHLNTKHLKIGFITKPLTRYLAWFHGQADLTTCPSNVTKAFLEEQGMENVVVFSRGVDPHRFDPAYRSEKLRKSWRAENKRVFLYVGRVSGEKDLDVLLEAWNSLPEDLRTESRMVVTGSGPILKRMQEDYPDVVFTGQKTGEELSRIYASADVFAFPSAFETFGNVVLEAMSSGLPVIVADEGGVLEMAEDRTNGLIARAKDVSSFKEKLTEMIRTDDLSRFQQSALATASDRTWPKVFERLNEDYVHLMARLHDSSAESSSRVSSSAVRHRV